MNGISENGKENFTRTHTKWIVNWNGNKEAKKKWDWKYGGVWRKISTQSLMWFQFICCKPIIYVSLLIYECLCWWMQYFSISAMLICICDSFAIPLFLCCYRCCYCCCCYRRFFFLSTSLFLHSQSQILRTRRMHIFHAGVKQCERFQKKKEHTRYEIAESETTIRIEDEETKKKSHEMNQIV